MGERVQIARQDTLLEVQTTGTQTKDTLDIVNGKIGGFGDTEEQETLFGQVGRIGKMSMGGTIQAYDIRRVKREVQTFVVPKGTNPIRHKFEFSRGKKHILGIHSYASSTNVGYDANKDTVIFIDDVENIFLMQRNGKMGILCEYIVDFFPSNAISEETIIIKPRQLFFSAENNAGANYANKIMTAEVEDYFAIEFEILPDSSQDSAIGIAIFYTD